MNKQKISIDLMTLVNSHEKPFVVINKNYQMMAFNEAYAKQYNIKLEETVGKMCYQVIRGKERPCKLDGEECPHYDVFLSPENTSETRQYDAIHHSQQVRITTFPLVNSEQELLLGKCIDAASQDNKHLININRMVGESRTFNQCVSQLDIAANSDVPVLLNGDTGTGKELAAIYIHKHSSRNLEPFQIIDCTVLSEATFESELFGYATGALSGCVGDKLGLFEMSDGGTVFLDKIGDLKLTLQSKLLRVLETGTFHRFGGTKARTVDVRIICATNKNLWELVTEGQFREDLYHRIVCMNIHIPSLSERIEDIPAIAKSLLDNINKKAGTAYYLLPDVCEHLKGYRYSGNIRELNNILFISTTLSDGNEITSEAIDQAFKNIHLETDNNAPESQTNNEIPSIDQVIDRNHDTANLEDFEIQHIKQLLEKYNGNRKQCANALGITERTFYRKLNKFGLNKK